MRRSARSPAGWSSRSVAIAYAALLRHGIPDRRRRRRARAWRSACVTASLHRDRELPLSSRHADGLRELLQRRPARRGAVPSSLTPPAARSRSGRRLRLHQPHRPFMRLDERGDDAQPHAGAAAVAARGEEGLEDAGAIARRDAAPSSATRSVRRLAAAADSSNVVAPWRAELSTRLASTMPHSPPTWASEPAALAQPHLEPAVGRQQLQRRGQRRVSPVMGGLSARASSRSRPTSPLSRSASARMLPRKRRRSASVIASAVPHQLGRAPDGGQRRFQLVRDMGGEGAQVSERSCSSPPCRGSFRELRQFARAVAAERPDGAAVAAAISSVRRISAWTGRLTKREKMRPISSVAPSTRCRERDPAALVVELLDDVAGRPRHIDDAGDAPLHDDRHRHEDPHRGAPADGIERRRRVLEMRVRRTLA